MEKNTSNDVTDLPDDFRIGDDLTWADQRTSIRVDTRRYGKPVTMIDGLDLPADELDALASTLERRPAVGGAVTDRHIELQGKYDERLEAALRDEGFDIER